MDDVLKNLNINQILKYLITGSWSYFVYYSILGDSNPLNKTASLFGVLIMFSFGAISYYWFRSSLFLIISIAGDLIFENMRLADAKKIKNNWLSARLYLICHWPSLNDNRQIDIETTAEEKFKQRYDLWLSSIIMMYLSGLYTILITAYFYGPCSKPLFERNIYYSSGLILIISAFISQRLYEKRLLRYWEKRVTQTSRAN